MLCSHFPVATGTPAMVTDLVPLMPTLKLFMCACWLSHSREILTYLHVFIKSASEGPLIGESCGRVCFLLGVRTSSDVNS